MSYLSERKCRACGEKQEMIGLNEYVDKHGVFYICHNCIRVVMNKALSENKIKFKETPQ